MTVFEHIRERLLQRAGLATVQQPCPGQSLDDLRRTQWCSEFEQLMRNRLVMGAMRYGILGAPGKKRYDMVSSMVRRLAIYNTTGNTEMLVDVANLALCEFVEGRHPLRHFSTDDTGEHVKPK